MILTCTVVVDDGHGGTASQELTITITGRSDGPVVQGVVVAAAAGVVEDGTSYTGGFIGEDVDSDDDGETLTYAITSQPSEG